MPADEHSTVAQQQEEPQESTISLSQGQCYLLPHTECAPCVRACGRVVDVRRPAVRVPGNGQYVRSWRASLCISTGILLASAVTRASQGLPQAASIGNAMRAVPCARRNNQLVHSAPFHAPLGMCSYFGEAVSWGPHNKQDSAEACCKSCLNFRPASAQDAACNGAHLGDHAALCSQLMQSQARIFEGAASVCAAAHACEAAQG